jgi:hypothetical protein
MAKAKKPLLGQITFRLPIDVHQELLNIAAPLGLDLSALLNQMLAEIRPAFLQRATEVAQRQAAARRLFEELALPPARGPLVSVAMDAGRPHQGEERMDAMIKAVAPARKPGDPLLGAILAAALEGLEKEQEKQQMEEAIRRWEADAVGDLGDEDGEPPG